MPLSEQLRGVVAAAAPFFAGEAEVVRTYWDWPGRTIETDLYWLELQCFKEFKGSGVGEKDNMGVIMGPLAEVQEAIPKMDRGISRHRILHLLEELHEEFSHLCAFADAYDAIRPEGTQPLDPHLCDGWKEDRELTELRYFAIEVHGELGACASKFTEGGYCTLFREGMRLKGRDGPHARSNAAIAAACELVYEDEFGHMLQGIAGLDDMGFNSADWKIVTRVVTNLLEARLHMRNGQFSYPLSGERIEAIRRGKIEPEPFDFEAAEKRLARQGAT